MPKESIGIHLVTVARNEENFLPGLIDSVLSQREKPDNWMIVDDGSSDRTIDIIDNLEAQYNWIESIKLTDRGYRDRGYGNTIALKKGFGHGLRSTKINFLGVMDADITFDELTIAQIRDAFLGNQNLGIYGGEIVEYKKGEWKPPVILPEDFVRGACKFYRRKCYQDIDGIMTRRGWDSVDNIKASMVGWDVKRDSVLMIKHHRSVGSSEGFAKDQYKAGRDAYYIGSDPILVLARGLRKLVKNKPYFAGGLIFLSAYFGNKFLQKEQYPNVELLEFVKKRHRQLLKEGFYKW